MTRIGWIGLGRMGVPMAKHVRARGHAVLGYARSAASQARASDAGIGLAQSMAAVAAEADVVFSIVSDDEALRDIMLGADGLAGALGPGQVLVEMSTVSPNMSAEVARALGHRDVAYVRAPVSGSTATAEAGALTVIASGPEHAFTATQPLLEAFSRQQFHVGPGEEARYLKLVLNALLGGTSALLAEALTLGRKGGLSTAQMMDVLLESAVGSPLARYKRDMLVEGDYTAQFSVAQMMKDLDLILACGREVHVPLFIASLARQAFETAFAQGDGGEDFFVLYRRHQQLAGL